MSDRRYIVNEATAYRTVVDPKNELHKSLVRIVAECPPVKPWRDSFKNKPMGLWTGPTSIAYLFLWLSKTHPQIMIEGRSPSEWCDAYLDCGSEDIENASGLNGWGIKNEYLAYNCVKAAASQDMTYVEKFERALSIGFDCPPEDNEHLSGRAGTLALLRIIQHWLPSCKDHMKLLMEPLIEHIMNTSPWTFHGHTYIGAAHGSIGIITQLILSDPALADDPRILSHTSDLLDLQTDEGHWYITDDPELGSPDIVHYCHGSPGFVMSLARLPISDTKLQARIATALERGRKEIWEKGLLTKEPNLCHGITGNMLALDNWEQKEHFMAYATFDEIAEGKRNGRFIAGDDPYGLLWGEAGKSWGWMVMDLRQDLGYPSYTDV